MKVLTQNYVFMNGRKPRGEDRWVFFFDGELKPLVAVGKYSEAKKQAVKYARHRGYKQIALGLTERST
jgi:hypothetical protein